MQHLERGLDNQNQWWKYLIVFVIGLLAGQLLGSIPLAVLVIVKMVQNGEIFTPGENKMDLSAFGIDPNLGLALMIIPFIVSLVIGVLLVKAFHKRTLLDVINGRKRIRWGRMLNGFILWAGLMAIYLFIDIKLNPGNFEFRFNLYTLIPLVIISLLLIPFQAGTEEYFFRGYLAQGVAGLTKQRWLVIFIPSILFGLLHAFNPEVKEYGFWVVMPQYILFGVLFGLISTLDDGIEVAIGAHAANNIFAAIFITTKASALQTPALFLQHEVFPLKELVFLLVTSMIFIILMSRRYKWNYKILTQRIEANEEFKEIVK